MNTSAPSGLLLRKAASKTSLRSAIRQSGRLYEIPLIFMGSSLLLAWVLPYAVRSDHPWLMAMVLGIYGMVQMFLLWVVKGWGRMTALTAIGIEAILHPWVTPGVFSILVLSMPALFLVGWGVDLWQRRRLETRPPAPP